MSADLRMPCNCVAGWRSTKVSRERISNFSAAARIRASANTLSLVVEDNGPGVPMESREAVFERFHRLGPGDSTGSGLGLAIVKELCAQCGASIRLDNPSHGGSGLVVAVKFALD